MLILIFFLCIGTLLVYVAKYNFDLVSVNLGLYSISDIPLFSVIIGSLLIGLILSYVLSIIPSIANALTLRGKNKEIKADRDEILELTKQVHHLELENEKQKNDTHRKPSDPNAL